jgi:NDP-sugar pyrophosphorylase family protein
LNRTVTQLLPPSKDLSDFPVLILAGGLGTRLRSAFDAGPKSMAPIGGRPFLEYLFLQIQRASFRNVLLCVGHGRSQIEQWAGDGSKWGFRIRYSVESEPRGTAGAVKLAAAFIDAEDLMVLNGDSFLAVDLRELVREHLGSEAWATIALVKVRDSARYGTVVVTPQGEIKEFLEKSTTTVSDSCGWYLVNGGVYVFKRSVLDIVPERKAVSLEREIFPLLLAKGARGFVSNGYFIDIGLPADFKRAQTELPGYF